MTGKKNISLKKFNTFGIDVLAKEFIEVQSIEEVQQLCSDFDFEHNKFMILGKGSNVLLSADFDGLVIKIGIKGISTIKETDEQIWLEVMGGEAWHEFVMYCVNNKFGGVENMALIPSSVGAAPIQNIGAYGAEIKNVIEEVCCIEIKTGNIVKFSNEECKFGYRDSIFKHVANGKFIIVSVIFRLSKKPMLNYSYKDIEKKLSERQISTPSIKDICDIIIEVRNSKLPDFNELGNAGSFFKNPIVSNEKFEMLKSEFPNIIGNIDGKENIKLYAGWLIESCGWKGKRIGNAGVHKDQALVIVNYGNASGEEILDLAKQIVKSVADKFGVVLSPEVNIF